MSICAGEVRREAAAGEEDEEDEEEAGVLGQAGELTTYSTDCVRVRPISLLHYLIVDTPGNYLHRSHH